MDNLFATSMQHFTTLGCEHLVQRYYNKKDIFMLEYRQLQWKALLQCSITLYKLQHRCAYVYAYICIYY